MRNPPERVGLWGCQLSFHRVRRAEIQLGAGVIEHLNLLMFDAMNMLNTGIHGITSHTRHKIVL